MDRKTALEELSRRPSLDHGVPAFWHGRLYSETSWVSPKTTWKSPDKPRDDHGDVPSWLTASEYTDRKEALETKLDGLVQLLSLSTKTVVYTGAGISRAAGIGQAARGKSSPGTKTTTAKPTLNHFCLAALHRHGLVHSWIQQTHHGLPQKLGSLKNASTKFMDLGTIPPTQYSGTLKQQESDWMAREAASADLVLVLGTSLGGLNADRVAHNAARRSHHRKSHNGDSVLWRLGYCFEEVVGQAGSQGRSRYNSYCKCVAQIRQAARRRGTHQSQ